MLRLFKVIREISLYRDYSKIIKKEASNAQLWSKRKLRLDFFNRIYTVINLPPEVLYSVDLPKESRPSFVISETKHINDYLKSLNLEELLTMWIEPVKGTDEESYLVVYQFLFRHLSWLWLLRFVIEISVILAIIFNFNSIISLF
jgi:hypothetical protein